MKEQKDKNESGNLMTEGAVEKTDISSLKYKGTGSLKFGTGFPENINGQDCWFVPGFGFYTEEGKYLGETKEEAGERLIKND